MTRQNSRKKSQFIDRTEAGGSEKDNAAVFDDIQFDFTELPQKCLRQVRASKQLYDVAVVGSGPAGLYTAHQLAAKGLKVVVLEAADYVGGRCKQIDGFVPWKYDVGAEIIHGTETIVNDIYKKQNFPTKQIFYSFPKPKYEPGDISVEYTYIGRDRRFVCWKNDDPEIQLPITKIHELVKSGRRGVSSTTNTTLLKHLANAGASLRGIAVADALFGKLWASDLEKLGIHEVAEEEDANELGFEVNLQPTNSFAELIKFLSNGIEVRTNWQVKEINYSRSILTLRASNGQVLTCGQVVVAVPASVLKDGDIKFVPELPEPKRDAIQKLGFGAALKVILKFYNRIFPENMALVECADCLFTQLWADGGQARETPNVHTVTAFVSGDAAEAVGKMDDKQKVLAFLQQLDQMFGTLQEPQPATKSFVDALVFDWIKQPFVRGGYSFPAFGSKGCRNKIARNVNGKLFFAGECAATSGMGAGTVNGALETAVRAAAEVLRYFKQRNKL